MSGRGPIRITIHDNANPSEGKVMRLELGVSLKQFIKQASEKLGIKGQRLFLDDGGEVDDVGLIRDGDAVYVSAGEAFFGTKDKGANGPIFSIAVMGPGSVGKSAMTLQYVQGVFVRDYDPTIEDAYRKNTAVDNEACMLDILDTAGQEDYTALRSTWMRERDGFLLVFAITERSTLDGLNAFFEQLQLLFEDGIPPFILVGNKSDLADNREVQEGDAHALAKSWGAVSYVETSARTGANIEKAFGDLVRAMRRRQEQAAGPARSSTTKKKWKFCNIL